MGRASNRSSAASSARRGAVALTPDAAQAIAERAHAGVLDAHGLPYIDHVRRVAETVGAEAKVVAWLHDTVEDTDLTLQDLSELGASQEQVAAVALLTRDPEAKMTYIEYVRGIAAADGPGASLARQVKLADLRDNLSRPFHPAKAGLRRRYRRAERLIADALAT